MGFPFVPPEAIYDEKGHIVAGTDELIRDMERGHAYVAYLALWVEEVRQRATEEQRQFLRDVGLDGVQDDETGSQDEATGSARSRGHDEEEPEGLALETPEPAKLFPHPAQAISILEAFAQRYDRSTVEHTGIELAIQTLRFITDSGQADAFCISLEEGQKPCPPEKLARFGITAP